MTLLDSNTTYEFPVANLSSHFKPLISSTGNTTPSSKDAIKHRSNIEDIRKIMREHIFRNLFIKTADIMANYVKLPTVLLKDKFYIVDACLIFTIGAIEGQRDGPKVDGRVLTSLWVM